MGSLGSGNFSDYSSYGGASKNQGGSSGEDECGKAYSIDLEEIERCEYYLNNGRLPANETKVEIRHNIRLEAITSSGNEVAGYLPTSFNFLANCLKAGIAYKGVVIFSSLTPLPVITIDIAP